MGDRSSFRRIFGANYKESWYLVIRGVGESIALFPWEFPASFFISVMDIKLAEACLSSIFFFFFAPTRTKRELYTYKNKKIIVSHQANQQRKRAKQSIQRKKKNSNEGKGALLNKPGFEKSIFSQYVPFLSKWASLVLWVATKCFISFSGQSILLQIISTME